MIIMANFNDGRGGYLAGHLLKPENDRVEILPGRHVFADDLPGQLNEMRAGSGGARYWHVTLNPPRDLNADEWQRVIALYEREFDLSAAPRAMVRHSKPRMGAEADHVHIVYATRDLTSGWRFRDRW